MALLNRIQSGLLYFDDFTERQLDPTIWVTSPSTTDRFSLTATPSYLSVVPDNVAGITARALVDIPTGDCMLDIVGNFSPSDKGDSAGLCAFMTDTNSIELLQYYDSVQGIIVYTNLRLIKRNESGLLDQYIGLGSSDHGKTWTIIGTANINGLVKMGLVLHSPVIPGAMAATPATPQATPATPQATPATPQATPATPATPRAMPATPAVMSTSNFDVDYVRIVRDNKIVVGNLSKGYTVNLYDSSNTLISSLTCDENRDHVSFDVMNIPMPLNGYLTIADGTGVRTEQTAVMQLWGGDIFHYGHRLIISHNNIVCPEDSPINLGDMVQGEIDAVLKVTNANSVPAQNVTASVASLEGNVGGNWVQIAPNDGTGLPGKYDKTAALGTIQPGASVNLFVTIKRDANYRILPRDYKFALSFTS